MATIKAIEGRSVHQIQSGQVIVDLTSVVKELVENSLDAGATSIDVRFRTQGLEAIEIQDNGLGIAKADYENLGLKHYTSKLSDYDDLANLNSFGFRGEALSSLCALSNLHIVTAQDGEAPKGTRLEFEQSGKLKHTSVAATQKGTLVVVESLFQSLPVRRRELEKNIKREYSKVMNTLNAYACVCTGVRFSVSQQAAKGKKIIAFSTRNNLTTKDNIANVYGAKTILALVSLDLNLEMQPTMPSQVLQDVHNGNTVRSRQIRVEGHISKPVHGEGRQTPDRQMFFVNSRPCALPQVAKAFNEVYRSYNMNQSPFVFANFKMDTNAYDVNVSPDKRTIMLHDQQRLLDTLKEALVDLFENQDQTMPTQQIQTSKLPSSKPLSVPREPSATSPRKDQEAHKNDGPRLKHAEPSPADEETLRPRRQPDASPESSITPLLSSSVVGTCDRPTKLIGNSAGRNTEVRPQKPVKPVADQDGPSKDKQKLARKLQRQHLGRTPSPVTSRLSEDDSTSSRRSSEATSIESRSVNEPRDSGAVGHVQTVTHNNANRAVEAHTVVQTPSRPTANAPATPANQGVMTVGPTKSRVASGPPLKRRRISTPAELAGVDSRTQSTQFTSSLHAFAAPGTQVEASQKQSNKLTNFFTQIVNGESGSDPDADEELAESEAESEETEEHDDASPFPSEVVPSGDMKDSESLDDDDKHKAEEEARVQRMVAEAEAAAAKPAQASQKRIKLRRRPNETVHNVVKSLSLSLSDIRRQYEVTCVESEGRDSQGANKAGRSDISSQVSAEERLSLTISKSDFDHLRIAGQFNLGFILAVRPASKSASTSRSTSHSHDELFIIDQHASDEIYNFHRLSANTTITPQPLVRPHALQLTAIEEETILDHKDASLAKNGFNITVDTSGDKPVGERCNLLTLPTSKETVFNVGDLEELLALLAETPAPSHVSPPLPDVDTSEHLEGVSSHRTLPINSGGSIVRPTKVRKMLAMRACRSSIMVGKALTQTGMQRVVRHMGEIERPWNCPHGRPTMRHLSRLDRVGGWDEWVATWHTNEDANDEDGGKDVEDGVWLPSSSQVEGGRQVGDGDTLWRDWIATQRRAAPSDEEEIDDDDEASSEYEEDGEDV